MFEDKVIEMNQDLDGYEMPQSVKRVYTCEEVQDILGVSRTTIYQLIKSGVFHTVRVGGQYRISKKSFDKWLDNQSESGEDCQLCE